MKKVSDIQNELVFYADRLGYKVSYTSYRPIAMNSKNKLIYIPPFTNLNVINSLCHELGHCIDYKKGTFDTNKYKQNKRYRLWKEYLAWYYGFVLCFMFNIPKKQYLKHAFKSWMTYLKQRKVVDNPWKIIEGVKKDEKN